MHPCPVSASFVRGLVVPIGDELYLSRHTIEWHMRRALRKLGVSALGAFRESSGPRVAAAMVDRSSWARVWFSRPVYGLVVDSQ